MSTSTIAYPTTGWGQHVTLHNARQGRELVVAWEVWFIALRAAAFGGWRPSGTTIGRDPRLMGYLQAIGQRVSAEDANAIGKALDKALDRHAKMTPQERAGATFAVLPHPEQRDQWHWLAAPGSERTERFGSHAPAFGELNRHTSNRSANSHAEQPIVVALRELARWLRMGGDLVLDGAVPPGWYPPGVPLAKVRILANARPSQLAGRAVGPGDVLDVSLPEARSAVAAGIAERLGEDGVPIPLPPVVVDSRFAAMVAQRNGVDDSTWS